MSSILRRIWQRIVQPKYLVGRDLEGNKYYEYSNANGGRPKRTVQYKRTYDMWTYIASGKRLPVQWTAWLTHTRPNSPSIEELQADLARQHRVQMNAAILDARDKEERERMVRPCHLQVSEPRVDREPERGQRDSLTDTRPGGAPTPVRDPWAEARRGSDEPQSWTPVVRRK